MSEVSKQCDIRNYIDIENFEIDDTFETMTRASKERPEALERIIYSDTDSSFIKLYKLFKNYFDKVPEAVFENTIMKFDEDSIQENLKISKQEFIDLIESVSMHLANFVNDNILVKFAKKYNISDENNWLDFKGEYLFSAIYLLMKKVYIYRQIAEKGVLDEKFDYLNIGIKSDKAAITNAIIQKLGQLILTTKNMPEIIKQTKTYILYVKKLIKEKDKRVAVPASLNKSIDEYGTNGEVPRGSLIYEYITNQRGLLRPGTKGKVYLINQIYWRKIPNYQKIQKDLIDDLKSRWNLKGDIRSYLNVIFIPEEFENHFDYSIIEINEDAQLVKVLLKPLQQLFTPLGIQVHELANVDHRLMK